MKSIITITASLLLSLNVFSQQISWDELQEVNKKPKGQFYSYIDKNGGLYNAGDKLKIGRPSDGKFFTYVFENVLLNEQTRLDANSGGNDTEIVSFRVSGTASSGFKIWMKGKGHVGIVTLSVDLENALKSGEIIGRGMTSDQALTELKKAKDKLDLELISREKYDEIKKDLSRYIK